MIIVRLSQKAVLGPADRLERGTDHIRLIEVHLLAEGGAGADTSALSRLGKRPFREREL